MCCDLNTCVLTITTTYSKSIAKKRRQHSACLVIIVQQYYDGETLQGIRRHGVPSVFRESNPSVGLGRVEMLISMSERRSARSFLFVPMFGASRSGEDRRNKVESVLAPRDVALVAEVRDVPLPPPHPPLCDWVGVWVFGVYAGLG